MTKFCLLILKFNHVSLVRIIILNYIIFTVFSQSPATDNSSFTNIVFFQLRSSG